MGRGYNKRRIGKRRERKGYQRESLGRNRLGSKGSERRKRRMNEKNREREEAHPRGLPRARDNVRACVRAASEGMRSSDWLRRCFEDSLISIFFHG